MRTEIGSEFWNIPICQSENNIFPTNTKWFLSGRTALDFIIGDMKEKQKFKSVALPSWCCDSMIYPFLNAGIQVNFYPVWFDKEQGLMWDISMTQFCDAVLIIDYFGYARDIKQVEYQGIIIRDLTHSLIARQYRDADYYFGSLRKWAGFWTGGFAWANEWSSKKEILNTEDNYIYLRRTAMKEKERYINGLKEDKSFLKTFAEAEELLEGKKEIFSATTRDITKAKFFDVEQIKKRRRDNAKYLLKTVAPYAVFSEVKNEDCPLFVPILAPDGKRDELRRYLISNEIYCPVHWPISDLHQLDHRTRSLYENELSLVCDQRYTEEDMDRMVQTIQCFYGRI